MTGDRASPNTASHARSIDAHVDGGPSVDKTRNAAHAQEMAEIRAFARRAFLVDRRQDGSYLRVTWHPEQRAFVMSHWRDDVCLAATHLDVAEVAPLVSLLGNGLAEAASTPAAVAPAVAVQQSWLERVAARIAGRRRASSVNVVSLPARKNTGIGDAPKWRSGS